MTLCSPKLIGHGTYGYIHSPALNAIINDGQLLENPENLVSKLLIKSEAEEEYAKYRIMQIADPNAVFHLGMPIMAMPDPSAAIYISSCTKKSLLDVCKSLDNWRLLIMPNGGVNIGKYAAYLYKNGNPDKANHRKRAQKLWVEFFRIMHGIQTLHNCGLVHHDLNSQNILYDDEIDRANIIDMNFLSEIDQLKKEIEDPIGYNLSIFHYNLPPEIVFYGYDDFEALQNFSYEECETFFNKIYIPRSQFGLESCVYDTSDNLIPPDKYENYLNNLFFTIDHDEEMLNAFDDIYRAYKTRILFGEEPSGRRSDDMDQKAGDLDSLEFEKSELPLREYMISQFKQFIFSDIHVYSHEEFLNDSIYTIDIFGFGGALLYVLLRTYHLVEHEFAMEMYDLIRRMIDTNVRTRIQIKNCMETFFDIMDRYYHESMRT